MVRFSESSPRAGVFTVKSNQKEVAFQADTLEAAVQWVKELKEVSLEKEEDYESHQHLSALSTPFTDQYKQIMCVVRVVLLERAPMSLAGTPRTSLRKTSSAGL